MPKLKIYLDTSVPNAYFDDRNTVRQEMTRRVWQELDKYEVFISNLVIKEIKATGDSQKRGNLLSLVKNFNPLPSNTDEVRTLAQEYVMRGVIPAKHIEDAVHIAVASINSMDVLTSWNFEHIVKLKTKREVNVINVLLGYNQIEIIEPAML